VKFVDDVFRITGSSDATKLAAFEVDGFTTGTTRTFTLPNASTTLAGLSVAQTWTAAQTNSASLTLSAASGKNLIVSSTSAATASGTGCANFAGGVTIDDATAANSGGTTAALMVQGGIWAGDTCVFKKRVGVVGTNSTAMFNISATTITGQTTQVLNQCQAEGPADCTARLTYYGSAPSTNASAYTLAALMPFHCSTQTLGAGSTVTRFTGFHVTRSAIATNNAAFHHKASTTPTFTGTWCIYNDTADDNYFGTGQSQFPGTTDASSLTTGAITSLGGASIAKTLLIGKGMSAGITSTATAAGTTTLTIASARTQVFTGTTTQTCQLPAANAAGAGVGIEYLIKNLSTGNVTVQRAGSDTINNASSVTSIVLAQWASLRLVGDGVSAWEVI
jgi:hypothetical protein